MLVIVLALLMLITSIPLNTIVTFAEGGAGGSSSGGNNSTGVTDDALNDEDIGLRFSVVTMKDGKRQIVQNVYGTYYIDVWADGYVPSYSDVTSSSRYSPAPALDTITTMRATYFDVTIAGLLEGKYTSIKGKSLMDIQKHLIPGEDTSTAFLQRQVVVST